MESTDWSSMLGPGLCITCLVPLVLLFIALRFAIWLERFALRHPLLVGLVPVLMWRRAERKRQEAEAQAQCNPQNGQYCVAKYPEQIEQPQQPQQPPQNQHYRAYPPSNQSYQHSAPAAQVGQRYPQQRKG